MKLRHHSIEMGSVIKYSPARPNFRDALGALMTVLLTSCKRNKNLSCSCICEKTCRLGHAFKNATKLLPPSSFYPLNPSRDQNRISHCQHRCIIRHTGDENKDNHQQSDFVFMHHQILKTDIKGTDAVSKEKLLSELGTE